MSPRSTTSLCGWKSDIGCYGESSPTRGSYGYNNFSRLCDGHEAGKTDSGHEIELIVINEMMQYSSRLNFMTNSGAFTYLLDLLEGRPKLSLSLRLSSPASNSVNYGYIVR